MSVPDEDTLRRFVLGQLPAHQAASVEAFIETHPDATTILDRLAADDAFTASLRGRTDRPAIAIEAEDLARRLERLSTIVADSERTRTVGDPGVDSSPDLTLTKTSENVRQILAPPQARDELGRLGEYRILRVLGEGGMGVVFEAEDTRLGRSVAIKAMRPSVAESPDAKARFFREAKSAAAIHHDHVIAIHHISEDRGVPFLVMPYLPGESLDDRVKREAILPVAEIIRIGSETAEGLAAAHDRGLIHRDIKPGNLWLEAPTARVKILDFGLARTVSTGGGPPADITQAGAVVGTPAYMSPEQGRGQPLDARSDLFSLGGVLYRMATGRQPFRGEDNASVLMALAADTPDDPRSLNPAIPPALSALIMQLLEKDPAKRLASARDVVRRLAEIPDKITAPDDTITVPPPPASRARNSRRVYWTAGVVSALAIAIGLYFAPTIVRIATNKGEMVLEIDDPNVEVFITPKAARVVMDKGKTKEREFELKAGDYEVEFFDPDTGARAMTKEFKVERGGKVVVRATMKDILATRKAKPGDPVVNEKPPAKDLFAGELIMYETFDDAAKCALPTVKTASKHARCEGGAYVLELPKAKEDQFENLPVAGPVKDLALAARVRAMNSTIDISFRRRRGDTRVSFLLFQVLPKGSWQLARVNWVAAGNDWKLDGQTMLANDQTEDPDLIAGNWVNVRIHSSGPTTEIWAGSKVHVRFTEPDRPEERLPLDPVGVDLSPTVDAEGPAKFEIDHVAVWKLPAPSAKPPATDDKPPPKDLFPGELIAYETFDAPTPDRPPRWPGEGWAKSVVADGVLRTDLPAKRNHSGRAHTFGKNAPDIAFATRARVVDASLFIAFGTRHGPSNDTWFRFDLFPDGSWRLSLMTEDWTVGRPNAKPTILAESAQPDRNLAAGKWVAVTGRAPGGSYELDINGRSVARGTTTVASTSKESQEPLQVGFTAKGEGECRLEIDYAAVWKLPSPARPKK
jgi:serine/threonine protein kinase